jgi:hypothetical protein
VGYDAQRAAVRPTSKAAEVVAATKTQPPVDTHDGLRPAIKEVGGVVPFMKAMAGGQTVAGIGHDEFNTLWNRQENEDWLKDQFRAVSPNMHEWIPSNQMQAIVDKAKVSHEGPNWIDLHNELRSPTPHVIFHPSASSHEAPDGSLVLHGHVGAIYLGATPQIKSQGEFHDELREVFLNAPDVATAVDGLKGVMKKWVWDGSPLPKPLSPGLKDSMGRPLDPKALMADRAAKYAEMTAMFDGLKGKFGKPRRGK